jgi:starvation-inducible DNA-binding protein
MTNHIGLDSQKIPELTGKLNKLLASYSILYLNVRGFHWNIKGQKFFEMHIKFEELYTDLQQKIDEIAERIVTLGVPPLHSYQDYLQVSLIKPVKDVSNPDEASSAIVNSLNEIIALEREILADSGEINDEGTNTQMSDYIKEQEKTVWMYSAYLER